MNKNEDLPHRKDGSGLNINSAGRPPKLRKEHKDFVVGMVDEKLGIVLEELMEQLNAQFMSLEIKKFTLHDFLTKKMSFHTQESSFPFGREKQS